MEPSAPSPLPLLLLMEGHFFETGATAAFKYRFLAANCPKFEHETEHKRTTGEPASQQSVPTSTSSIFRTQRKVRQVRKECRGVDESQYQLEIALYGRQDEKVPTGEMRRRRRGAHIQQPSGGLGKSPHTCMSAGAVGLTANVRLN